MAIQHLRSSTANKRPLPASMSDGQVAINTNTASPGVFFKDSAGALIKVGPTHVGTTAPNASPASGGATGNTVGEQWLDTTGSTYVLKIWDGSAWRSESGTFVDVNGDTMTGTLVMDNQQQVRFRETTANGTNYIAIQAPASVAADRTLTLPDVSGTIVSTGDTGTVTSTMIADGTIVNADVNASAAIVGTKISPDFGSQNVTTTGTSTAASFIPTSSTAPTNGLYLSAANSVALSTNGTGRLFVDASGNIATGVATYSKPLTINNANAAIALRANSGGTYSDHGIFFAVDGANYSQIYNDGIGQLIFRTGSALNERLRITSTGQLSHIGAGSSGSPAVSFNGSAASNSLVVDSNSRVGIGTSAPSTKLAIADTTNQLSLTTGTQELILRANSTEAGYYTFQSIPLVFYNNNQERLRITSTGNVGIGTASPSSLLSLAASNTDTVNYYSGPRIAISNTSATANNFAGLAFQSAAGNDAAAIWSVISSHTAGSATASLVFGTSNASGASSERMRITSTGNVGIGTVSPGFALDVQSGDIRIKRSASDDGALYFGNSTNNYIFGSNTNNIFAFATNGSERARIRSDGLFEVKGAGTAGASPAFSVSGSAPANSAIVDSVGRLLLGTSTSVNTKYDGSAFAAEVQIANTGVCAASLARYGANADGSAFVLNKSRGALNVQGSVIASDTLGYIGFAGSDGANQQTAATIRVQVDGTPATNDMPGRLIFSTTSAGLASPTERMRITSGGFAKHTNDGNYISATGTFHEFRSTINNANIVARSTNAAYTNGILQTGAVKAANSDYTFIACLSSIESTPDNEFILRGDGNAFADGTWTGGGADYAEYFEWSDENPDAEDRRGISVVLDGDKIREALAGEDPIGVISGNPSVVGDAAWNKWSGKYLRDEYGTYIQEDYEVEDDDGNIVVQQRRKLNPAYDPDVAYIPREERPEWDCVGLMGKLRIRKGQVTGSRWIKMRDINDSVEEWLVR